MQTMEEAVLEQREHSHVTVEEYLQMDAVLRSRAFDVELPLQEIYALVFEQEGK